MVQGFFNFYEQCSFSLEVLKMYTEDRLKKELLFPHHFADYKVRYQAIHLVLFPPVISNLKKITWPRLHDPSDDCNPPTSITALNRQCETKESGGN